jgi:peptidoglycan/xylan/chitin deacetylase (PgdA/CDA1 family)
MKWLARTGHVAIDFDRFVDYRHGHAQLPPRPVLITFDDGLRDCTRYAVPILRAYGFTATFYLVVACMGTTTKWLLTERGINLAVIDWAIARELESQGFRCGAHSMSHPHLAEISAEMCRYELANSRQLLEVELGHEVRDLAYPFGSYNVAVQAIAREVGYRSACSVRIGLSKADDDIMALHRIPVLGQDTLIDFMCRLRTAQTPRELWRNACATTRSRED